jgi:hypothetical protein
VKYFTCPDCEWSYVIGKKRVYCLGPNYPGSWQHMMTRAEFEYEYADCASCYARRSPAKVRQS